MRKLAFLTSVVLMTAGLVGGCGGGSQTPSPLAARSVSLSIRDNPPAGVSVLSFEIAVTGASLQPSDPSKPAVSLVTSPIEVELTQLQTEKAFLNAVNAPADTYSSISLTFATPELTILNQSGQPITMGTQTCLNGQVCEFKPSLNLSSVTVSAAPFPVTISASSPIGLVVDFDLNSSIQNNLSVSPSVTLAAVPAQPSNGEIEDVEGLTGRVQSISSTGFTLQDSTSGQTLTINVDNNTKFEDFKCAANPNNFSCLQVGQIVEVEHLLVMDSGTLLASEVQLDGDVNENQLEGIVVALDLVNNQFQMVIEDEEPTVPGVSVGNSVTIAINPGAMFSIDSDGLSGSIPPAGASFASVADLLPGQEVKVQALVGNSSTPGSTVPTDRVRLHMSQFTASVSAVNAPNFTVNNLPGYFTGINQIQVQTSSGTEFEGVSGVSALNAGNTVSLRGLLFKTAGDSILVAKKVRKP